MQNLEYDEYDSYKAIQIIEDIEQLFFIPDLELITNETNTFLIRKAFLLPILPLAAILIEEDDNSLFFVILDNDALFLR